MSGRDFTLLGRETVYDGFLRIDQIEYDAPLLGGGPRTQVVVRNADAAAILLLDERADEVLLVRQFRAATLRTDAPGEGWVLELPTGTVRGIGSSQPETPKDCALREASEELGCFLDDCRHLVTLLPSPEISAQRIYLYFAVVQPGTVKPIGGVAGNRREGAAIQRVKVPDLLAKLEAGELQDAKLVVAAQWLRDYLRTRQANNAQLASGRIRYACGNGANPGMLGLQLGALDDVRDIDIWINPENTDMQMARFFEPTISGRIRYLGARKSNDGTIRTDTIADALRQAVADQIFVKPGSVISTTPGELHRTHQVKEIFHVASTQYSPTGRVHMGTEFAAEGLKNAFRLADDYNRSWWRSWFIGPMKSMLVPLMGAGNGGVSAAEAARALVPTAIKHLVSSPKSKLREVHFLAYREREREEIEKAIKEETHRLGLKLERLPTKGDGHRNSDAAKSRVSPIEVPAAPSATTN